MSDVSADRIKTIDAFQGLSDDDLERVASLARPRDYEPGDEILRQDEWPEDLLAIEEGTVEVRRDGEVLAELGDGCVVGERGVIRRSLRNADVVAATPVKALFFHLNKVRSLRKDVPELDDKLQAIADQREG